MGVPGPMLGTPNVTPWPKTGQPLRRRSASFWLGTSKRSGNQALSHHSTGGLRGQPSRSGKSAAFPDGCRLRPAHVWAVVPSCLSCGLHALDIRRDHVVGHRSSRRRVADEPQAGRGLQPRPERLGTRRAVERNPGRVPPQATAGCRTTVPQPSVRLAGLDRGSKAAPVGGRHRTESIPAQAGGTHPWFLATVLSGGFNLRDNLIQQCRADVQRRAARYRSEQSATSLELRKRRRTARTRIPRVPWTRCPSCAAASRAAVSSVNNRSAPCSPATASAWVSPAWSGNNRETATSAGPSGCWGDPGE